MHPARFDLIAQNHTKSKKGGKPISVLQQIYFLNIKISEI